MTELLRRARIPSAHIGVLSLLSTFALVVLPATAEAAKPSCSESAATEVAAAAMAKACGKPVIVGISRTEFTQTSALPDGDLTVESAVEPQRVRTSDGTWVAVNLALVQRSDGRLRPNASIADLSISDGGTGSLVTLTREGKTWSLSWPGRLPKPTIVGDSATYAEVQAGVDLVVRATRTGFAHVLVVKNAQAAASVSTVRWKIGGDARLVRSGDGGLQAVAGGQVLAFGGRAAMWDSNDEVAPELAQRVPVGSAGRGLSRSTHSQAGDAARTAEVAVSVTRAGELELTPDPAMLQPSAKFPVYIDPDWSTAKSRWAYATDNNSTNSDISTARVGLSPGDGQLYRSFFDFPITGIAGKQVKSAYVHMKVDHTYSCSNTYNHMYQTTGIASTPRTKWSPSLQTWLSSAASHANEAGGCGTTQNDMDVNFTGSAVTNKVAAYANAGTKVITIGFCACNDDGDYETSVDRWKKYFPNEAKLITTINSRPTVPTELAVMEGVTPVSCPATVGSAPLKIRLATPIKLRAKINDPDTPSSGDEIYDWFEKPANGIYNDTVPARTPITLANQGANAVHDTPNPLSGLLNGHTYVWRVRSKDLDNASAGYSPWSQWCEFKIDTMGPVAPTVTSTAYPPTGKAGGPGIGGTFKLRTAATDVTRIEYWVDGVNVHRSVTPTAPATFLTANTDYLVEITPPYFGRNIVYAQAFDSAGNGGGLATYAFTVNRPSDPMGSWRMQEFPGFTGKAYEDQQPDNGGATDLTATSVALQADARVVGGSAASFNGSSSAAVSNGPVVDTTGSFSVAAWLRPSLIDPVGDRNALGQDANMSDPENDDAGGFYVGIRRDGSGPHWSFQLFDTPSKNTTATPLFAQGVLTTANVGIWTHVAAVYDKPSKKMFLYVNGVKVAERDRAATAWPALGRFTIGRTYWGGPGNYWAGEIADVVAYNRALEPQDFTGIPSDPNTGTASEPGLTTPVRVGQWDMESVVSCYDPTITEPGICVAPENGMFGRQLRETQGVDTGAGFKDNAILLDGQDFAGQPSTEYATVQTGPGQDSPVLHTKDSFTVSFRARLDSPGTGSVVSLPGQHESAFWIKTNAPSQNWNFCLTDADVFNAAAQCMDSGIPAVLGIWTQLTAVYDAATRTMKVYVDDADPVSLTLSGTWTPDDFSGPLTVGRTRYRDQWVDYWYGAIDDLQIFQGALTFTQVKDLPITYNLPPDAPDDVTVGGYPCGTGSAMAYITTRHSPVPAISMHLTDPNYSDRLEGHAVWTDATGTNSQYITNIMNGGTSRISLYSSTFTPGTVYTYSAFAQDAVGPSPVVGPCEFTVDDTEPATAPVVSSADGRYPAGTDNGIWRDGVGIAGTFTFDPAGVADIAGYYYGLNTLPSEYVQASALGQAVTIELTPQKAGANVLAVRSADQAGNMSPIRYYRFWVGMGTPAVGSWRMDDPSGAIVADSATPAHNATLTGTYTRNAAGNRVGVAATSFNGTTAYATATSPIATNSSFTVSAWARLTDLSMAHTVVARDGSTNSPFYLQFNGGTWRFAATSADTTTATNKTAIGPTAVANVWTHLTGVYDAPAGQIRLYVNGVYAGSDTLTSWNATGPLTIGRAKYHGANGDWWKGEIAEVRAWQRALAPEEIAGLAQPTLVAAWDFEESTGTTTKDGSTFGHDGTLSGTELAWDGYGRSGIDPKSVNFAWNSTGVIKAAGPALRTDQSFSVAAWVLVTSTSSFQTAFSQDGTTNSGFFLQYRQTEDRWGFSMVPDAAFSTGIFALSTVPTYDWVWTHLAGVYDANAKTITLYVDGVKQQTVAFTASVPTTGALMVGQAKWNGTAVNQWHGMVDAVRAYQGVLTDAQIAALAAQ